MIRLGLIRNRVLSLILIFCLLRKSVKAEDTSTQNIPMTLFGGKSFEVSNLKESPEIDKLESTRHEDIGKESLTESNSIYRQTNQSIRNFDIINDLLNPILSFPFFPFRNPEQKKRMTIDLNGNSFDEKEQITGNRSRDISKPFIFIDFPINVETIPINNQTNELKSSEVDKSAKIYPEKSLDESVSKEIIHFFDDDQSFFDNAPFPPQDFYDVIPKPHWLLFDIPFLGKQYKRNIRNKVDKSKIAEESNSGSFMNIFENAISRMKREMEKTMPIQEFVLNGEKTIPLEEQLESFLPPVESNFFREPRMKNPTKFNEIDSIHSKTPILLGKIVKIRKIHFSDDYPKNKLKIKRKNSFSSGKKEKHELHENSVKKEKDDFRNIKDHKQGRMIRGTQDAKIMDLLAEWDRRMMEEQVEGKTPKIKTLKDYNEKINDETEATMSKDDKFKYVDQFTGKRKIAKNKAEFKILKSQTSLRKKRQGNDGGKGWENVTASKDEIRRNITQFFSMIKKLGKANNWYQDENQETVDMVWPELGQVHNLRHYEKNNPKKRSEEDEIESEEEHSGSTVADLQFLFLTVTLPTTLALSLLLVACFYGLRPKSRLCQKIFNDRNVYIVEEDTEKGKELDVKEEPINLTKEKKKFFKESRKKKNEKEFKNTDLNDVNEDILKSQTEMMDEAREIKL